MPKGIVAPGKTLPPLVVPTKGLTRDAGSGWLAKAEGEMSAASRQRRTELGAACMAVGYGMPGGRFCWLAMQRALELSAELVFGSRKGDRLHGTEVTYGK
jgi:hypothetical protein